MGGLDYIFFFFSFFNQGDTAIAKNRPNFLSSSALATLPLLFSL